MLLTTGLLHPSLLPETFSSLEAWSESEPAGTAATSGGAQSADTAGTLQLGALDDLDLASLCLPLGRR